MKSAFVLFRINLMLLVLMLLSFKCLATGNNTIRTDAQVSSFLSEKQFNDFFPRHDKFYSYEAFIKAVRQMAAIRIRVVKRAVSVYQITRTDKSKGKSVIVRQDEDWNEDWAKKKPDSSYTIDFGNFCNEKDPQTNKKELAAFFANVAHETRHGENGKYDDGLMFIHESNTSLAYVADNDNYPPVPGKKYYGRGPLQLSYNGNYGYASDCIFGNKSVLLENPDLVETDPVVAFKAAIYFWMTPQTYKPSAHDVMIGKWQPNADDRAKNRKPGFGMTINIINGAVECGQGEKVSSMNDRSGFYQHFLKKLGVSDPDCACSCGQMKPYK
jgi:basic endochitinase B